MEGGARAQERRADPSGVRTRATRGRDDGAIPSRGIAQSVRGVSRGD